MSKTLGVFFLFFFFSLPAFSQSKLVYMQETVNGKQILLSGIDGKFPQEITEGNAWHLYPDIDSKGRWVVYVEGENQRRQGLVAHEVRTGKKFQLVPLTDGLVLHPDFSGDGKTLAYSAPNPNTKKNEIVILDLKESAELGLTATERTRISGNYPSFFPCLSSDGKVVYFQRSKSLSNRDLVRVDLQTKKEEVLTNPNGNSMAPALSFDDRFLAYTSLVDGNWDIYLLDLQNRNVNRLTYEKSNDFAPTFLPDGNLIFSSDRSGSFQLFALNVLCVFKGNQSCIQKNAEGEGNLYAPSVSGDLALEQSLQPAIPGPARSSFGAVATENAVFAIGGHKGLEHTYPPESFSDTNSIFDFNSQTWHEGKPRPTQAHGYGLSQNGRYVYAFGGFVFEESNKPKWKSVSSIDRYDLLLNEWKTVGELPRKRSSNVVATVGKKVFLIGGWDSTPLFPGDLGGTFHREVDVFDMETETIQANVTSLPDPLRRAFTGVVYGDEIYLLGGITRGGSHFNLVANVTVYNTRTQTWQEAPSLPFATFAPGAGILKDEILLFGGMHRFENGDFDYVNHVYRFSLKKEIGSVSSWEHTGRFLLEPKGFSQVVSLPEGKLGVLGGHVYKDETNFPVPTFEIFSQPESRY